MIRKAEERVHFTKQMFGAPGEIDAYQILNVGEFADKGRLFNHITLKPGCGIGKHRHSNDFEVYYILSGTGLYDDNGTEVVLHAGDVAVCLEGEEHALINNGTDNLEMIALVLFDKKD